MDTNKTKGVEYAILKIANIHDTSIHKGVLTDSFGTCLFINIPTGTYRLKVFDLNYDAITIDNLNIHNDTTITISVGRNCIYDKHNISRICPKCNKSNKVIPIVYGLVIRKKSHRKLNNRNSKKYYAGCIITHCDPNWYCKRDKTKF